MSDTEITERVATLEADMRHIEEEVRVTRDNVHEVRSSLHPVGLRMGLLEAAVAALKARGPAVAVWLVTGSTLVAALGSLWLAWSTARAQPDLDAIATRAADGAVAKMEARGRR